MTDLQTAFSSESGRTYQLDKLIGKGGFGEVYLATPTPRDGLPEQVCIKITERLSGWLREAYFAERQFWKLVESSKRSRKTKPRSRKSG